MFLCFCNFSFYFQSYCTKRTQAYASLPAILISIQMALDVSHQRSVLFAKSNAMNSTAELWIGTNKYSWLNCAQEQRIPEGLTNTASISTHATKEYLYSNRNAIE